MESFFYILPNEELAVNFGLYKVNYKKAHWASIYKKPRRCCSRNLDLFWKTTWASIFRKSESAGAKSTPCIYTCIYTLFHKALAAVYSSNPRALRHPSPRRLPAPVVAIAAITRTNMANFDALFLSPFAKTRAASASLSPASRGAKLRNE